MAEATQEPLSLTLEETARLVRVLYSPGDPKEIAQADAALRVIQRCPQGWELADALLNSSDENLRFFGALTFTIKINTDSDGLDEDALQQLLHKLIQHVLSQRSLDRVSRKLCSALSRYFCKPFCTWTQSIRSLAVSFALQRPVFDSSLDQQASTWDILPAASTDHLLIILEFASEVAIDGARLVNSQGRDQRTHERIISNIEAIEVLLQASFNRAFEYISRTNGIPQNSQLLQMGEKLAEEAVRCFNHWVCYAAKELRDVPEKLQHLRSVTELVLRCLELHIEGAMEFVSDIFELYPYFFEAKERQSLWSAITSSWGINILQGLDAESVKLATIIVAYGNVLLDANMYQEPDDPHHGEVMSVLHELLRSPEDVSMSEDDTAVVALEFWSNYVTTISDTLFEYTEEDEKPTWSGVAMHHVFTTMSELLKKVIYPSARVYKSWDEDTKKTFSAFRVDVADIIQEAFNILRTSLLSEFVDFTMGALQNNEWMQLEAGLFCLMSLEEQLREVEDEQLERLFDQQLFTVMLSNADIPVVTRRSVVEAIAAFRDFFFRHTLCLPQVLTFLFSALEQAPLAHLAARSFAALCSECRTSLTAQVDQFFHMYQQFQKYPTAGEETKVRVLQGIAAVVQAQQSDEQRLAGIQRLFQYVRHDAAQVVHITKGDPERGLALAVEVLRCLSAIGKSMRASDDTIIDLESSTKAPSDFWTQGAGKDAQDQIISLINYLTSIFAQDGDVVEAGCSVFRAGFRETVPGPFVLPPSATIDYVVRTTVSTPRLPYVLETACCWIAAYKDDKTGEYDVQCGRLLRHVVGLLQVLQHPRSDPEISVCCIELLQKFINTKAHIFSIEPPEVLEGVFNFSVECIRSPEVLPKRAAAELWRDIFSLCASTGSPYQSTGQSIVDYFGPAVTSALIHNLCGEVDQSSLDHVLIPLRRLINVDRNARSYISQALSTEPLLIQAKDQPDLAAVLHRFNEGLIRNSFTPAAFKNVAKEFWQHCKALLAQYNAATMHPGHRFAHSLPRT